MVKELARAPLGGSPPPWGRCLCGYSYGSCGKEKTQLRWEVAWESRILIRSVFWVHVKLSRTVAILLFSTFSGETRVILYTI